MNRNKVLELAREAELARQFALEVPFVVDRLERFATLVEREVLRGGMSRDKVFELMLTAGCSKYCDPKHPELEGFIVNDSVLDRIVALIEREVRVDERETCATICDHRKMVTPEWQMDQHYNQACSHCAQAIRLRGRV